ncbi:MAG: (E)-4-hydroxy-3-methylbut-2-enyl-diphosphate synthase [Deltaproteobacteria bacterium]|nr:(E)-4-hydroxy-3-methylbut-2-enyl-diphosphate synthase [Deltaproteobacteria bacterium]MBW2360205.1 (E)-4-hydroxy-3-methylbut-2-enyl-diphosphate synthase [Deltaproteobacteria bacterium]
MTEPGARYVASPYSPRRRVTYEVRVGDVGIGGDNPIRIQSMTTTDTRDTAGTCDQIERLADASCEIARVTAPSVTDAENLREIQAELRRRGVRIPLVADIHFTPNAALIAAEHVEKVRINPGNFADKKKFDVREYTDAEYREEIERVAERFRPLVRRCSELGRAMRIGTNHGSLSDRILNRFGDTPRGMVESALEFLDVCEDEGYRDVIFSMKASNAQVAVQAYRMLAARLAERAPGPSVPFHVGVTEAGDGEDGRIKSAIGIGGLLADGIGDTIRVSLTEAPEKEIPVARALARRAEQTWAAAPRAPLEPGEEFCENPYAHRRRSTRSIATGGAAIGGANPVRVELDLGPVPADPPAAVRELARALDRADGVVCEGLLVESFDPTQGEQVTATARALDDAGLELPLAVRAEACWLDHCAPVASRLVVPLGELVSDEHLAAGVACLRARGLPVEWELRARLTDVASLVGRALTVCGEAGIEDVLFSFDADLPVHVARLAVACLRERGAADVPIVLRHRRNSQLSHGDDLLRAATDLGALLCDGIGDAVSISGDLAPERALDLAYRVLQGARQRTTWTEFISCPSCGRTLFDLEETTARIKARTQHLSGVKIAIMGCIVNGPGEMADADFGYVGSGPGLVNLYVGKQCIARQIPDAVAADRLVDLIREHGLWSDPS